jgi:hypothetical protein
LLTTLVAPRQPWPNWFDSIGCATSCSRIEHIEVTRDPRPFATAPRREHLNRNVATKEATRTARSPQVVAERVWQAECEDGLRWSAAHNTGPAVSGAARVWC